MSDHGERDQRGVPPINEGLIIDTVRIEAERQRREQQERDKQHREQQAKHDRQMLHITMGLLVAALLTGIASLYQAYVSGRNADAAVEAVRIAKDTLYITESADIELEGCNCSTAPQLLNAQTRIAVIYKNTGRTSAARVKSRIFTGFEGDTGPGTTVGPEGESTVGAGQSIGTGFSGLGMPHVAGLPGMTPQIESAINMSAAQEITAKIATRQLRVVSWVTYYDKFERGHITLLESTYERGTTCMFLTRKIISR